MFLCDFFQNPNYNNVVKFIVNTKKVILLFDGVCNLCNYWVSFLMKRDKKEQFLFVPLRSEEGKEWIVKYKIPKETDSIIVIAENRIYLESEAVIKIIGYLQIPWKWFQLLRIIPLNIRDKIYQWVAQNRFKWFGRRKTCRII